MTSTNDNECDACYGSGTTSPVPSVIHSTSPKCHGTGKLKESVPDPEVTVHNERCEFGEDTATSGALHGALHAEHRGRHRTAGGYEFGLRIEFPRRAMVHGAGSTAAVMIAEEDGRSDFQKEHNLNSDGTSRGPHDENKKVFPFVGGRFESGTAIDGHIHQWQWFETRNMDACTICQISKYTVEPIPVESWAKNLKRVGQEPIEQYDTLRIPPGPAQLKSFFPNVGTILFEIRAERIRQDELKAAGKFKMTCADPDMTDLRALSVLAEEFGEVSREVNEKEASEPGTLKFLEHKRKLREELIQMAAVCLAWVEKLDG